VDEAHEERHFTVENDAGARFSCARKSGFERKALWAHAKPKAPAQSNACALLRAPRAFA